MMSASAEMRLQMKFARFFALAMACTLLSSASFAMGQSAPPASLLPAQTAQAQPWKTIAIPPLHAFKPKQPTRIELHNGLVIFLQEDHELPFIDGSILIRGGSRNEPAAKVGLVSLYGDAWRTSGSAAKSGDALDAELAAKAASIETSGGPATTSIEWSSFKQDFDTVFAETLDLLQHPAFKAEKLELAKHGLDTGISRRNDEASTIAERESTKLVYGADSPYARTPEYATVASISLDDLKSWHDRTVVPNGMIVAVSGDFDVTAMEATLRKVFEPLPRGAAIEPVIAEFAGPKPGVYFVDKPDVDQSSVEIVGLGTTRNNPDYFALNVMNEIFSGGFGSRLFQSVRTRLGLAYDVSGNFGTSYDHPGVFRSEAGTKSATTVAAAQAILAEITRLKTDPPTPDELQKAKDDVINSFIFNYDTPEKTLNEQVLLAFFHYPPDFLEKYREGVERVTAADVTRVANQYIDVSKLAILVVGNKSEIQPPLSALGKLTDLDVTIPPPAATKR
jgi:zinc protease